MSRARHVGAVHPAASRVAAASAAWRKQCAAASPPTDSSRTQRCAASGRRCSMAGRASAHAAQHAAGATRRAASSPRPPKWAGRNARERACCQRGASAPGSPSKAWSACHVSLCVLGALVRGHGPQDVLGPRRRAVQQQEPRALQVRQLRGLLQQGALGFQAGQSVPCHKLCRADGRAQCQKPPLVGRSATAPGAEFSDAGRGGAARRAVHARLALVGRDASVALHRPRHCVPSQTRAVRGGDDVQVV